MAPDWLEPLMKWVVVPLAAWNWRMHSNQAHHRTEIEVLKAQQQSQNQTLHEIKTILRDIQQALRK